MMDLDFFERALYADKIKIEEGSIPTLVANYKNIMSNSEDYALNFISCQAVPVLNQYRKIDSTGKLNKYINTVKAKKLFQDDAVSSAVNLVGITDFFVCSLLNDSLINIFQKPKDKAKIKYYLGLIQCSWHRFLNSNISDVEMVDSLRHFLFQWNDMLKQTEHSKIFSNVTVTANEKYKSLKNLKDKKISTNDDDNTINNKSKSPVKEKIINSPDPNPLKRNLDSVMEIQIEDKPKEIASPVPKKMKVDIRNYFSSKKDKREDLKFLDNNNKILKERLDFQIVSPVKKISSEKIEKENNMDIEIVKENKAKTSDEVHKLVEKEKNLDLGKTPPPKINAFQKLMASAKKRSLDGCK